MRISSKGRYALAAAFCMAQRFASGEHITVISISERLGISKIYLEQVFSLLKRGGLVSSAKGAQGGYQLSQTPEKISVLDVLSAAEAGLFEKTEDTVLETAPDIESAMRLLVFDALDRSVSETLRDVSLADLLRQAEIYQKDTAAMYYI